MTDKTTTVKAAQTAALFLSSATFGGSLGLSALLIPRLLESPVPVMLRQWHATYQVAKRAFPAGAQLAAASYVGLAYRAGLGTLAGRAYAASAALCFGIIPYTLVFLIPTNRKLLAKVADAERLGPLDELVEASRREESARYLVDWWGVLNLGRAAMLASAGVLGIWVSL